MIIVFGRTARVKPASQHGQFYCPSCGQTSTYRELRLKTYFHLFYVPLLPLSDDPYGIQCCNCKNAFDDDQLSRAAPDVPPWKCPQCNRKWPDTNIRCPICKIRPDGTPA